MSLLWAIWSFLPAISVILPRTSTDGGQSLVQAPNPVVHHSTQETHSESYSINSILRAKGAMGNLPMEFLLDSGAAVSVVRHGALNVHYQSQINNSSTLTAFTANGASLNILVQVDLPVTIGKFKCVHTFIVADNVTVDCILGADCLMRYGAVIDCKECTITMGGIKFSFVAPLFSATPNTGSTVCILLELLKPLPFLLEQYNSFKFPYLCMCSRTKC